MSAAAAAAAAAEAYRLEWFDLRNRALLKVKQARNGIGNGTALYK
jgi:hypothetical protein